MNKNLLGLDDAFAQLVNSVGDYAIFLLDESGRVATWNRGAERIKGYTAAEILGQHFSIFYPDEANQRRWPAAAGWSAALYFFSVFAAARLERLAVGKEQAAASQHGLYFTLAIILQCLAGAFFAWRFASPPDAAAAGAAATKPAPGAS